MAGMTFPLGSLSADGSAAARSPGQPAATPRWRQQLMLVAGAVAWLLLVLALVTHHPGDAAFTTYATLTAARWPHRSHRPASPIRRYASVASHRNCGWGAVATTRFRT